MLAGIYARILGVPRVGAEDSFFDLGGDSLSAMRLVAAVNEALGAGLSVRAVFEAPTVAQLAGRVGVRVPPVAPVRRWRAGGGAVVVCPAAVVFLEQLQGRPRLQHGGGVAAVWAAGCGGVGAALSDVVAAMRACARCFPRWRDTAAGGGAG
ncbi:phosphopantetheine attachment site family protein [Mycobacterium xenopi 3993]|nr:phosphopantetheine attachment site family protein [Mycobacterium xenopi 3993]